MDILKQLESPDVTQASLAKIFGASASQVLGIVKAKGEIFQQFDNGGNREQKRQRSCKCRNKRRQSLQQHYSYVIYCMLYNVLLTVSVKYSH